MQEKLQIVLETLSDESVALVARRHGINANQVFAWRRQYQRGEFKGGGGIQGSGAVILPVHVAPSAHVQRGAAETDQSSSRGPRIEIELAEGPRVKIWDISSETVRALIRDLVRPC